jgi:hypothetical protein
MTYTYGSFTSESTFNSQTGQFTFQSADKVNFPPGNYDYTITATIGSMSKSVTFTLSLLDPCSQATLSIGVNPFAAGSFTYVLRSQALNLPFDRNTMATSTTTVNCGTPVVSIMTSHGSTQIDNVIRVDQTY